MKKFIPNSYYKTVYDIDYDMLYKKKIKCIMFDLDNTLALIDEGIPPKKVIDFIKKLNKRFDTYIKLTAPLVDYYNKLQILKTVDINETKNLSFEE